ncbi:MAG: Rieske 2Fe-2S domain-containing protein [Myxococcota bacterium]
MTIKHGLDRRDVLALGGAGAMACLGLGCATGAKHVTFSPAKEALQGSVLSLPMAELKNISGDEALLVKPGSPYPDILVACREGQWLVVTSDCTHWGCTVGYSAAAKEWQCPCHGSRFAEDGKVLEGPAEDPLKAATASVEGEVLKIELAPLKD